MSEPRRIAFQTNENFTKEKTKELLPTIRFCLSLGETTDKSCPEYNYTDLVKSALPEVRETNMVGDPYEEDEDKLMEIARKFEEKYGPKVGRKKENFGKWEDYVDRGMGYDETDPFIDNDQAYDELVPSTLTTQYGGFYINTGNLDFKVVTDSDSEGNRSEHKRKRHKDTITKDNKKRAKLIKDSGDGSLKKAKKHLSALEKQKRKSQPTVAELIQQYKSQNVQQECKEGNEEPPVAASLNMDVALDAEENVKIEDAIESVIKAAREEDASSGKVISTTASSDSEELRQALDSIDAPKLPENLPSDLDELLTNIKQAAYLSGEGKCKFFSGDVNIMLLNIELKSRKLTSSQRSMIYAHLASHLPCTKETLQKRAKKLVIGQEDGKLRIPMQQLKDAISEVMPQMEAKCAIHCQQLGVAENVEKETDSLSDTDSEKYQSLDEEEKKTSPLPRKKFEWNDHIRELLCDVVRIKLKCYEVSKMRTQSAEDYLRLFLKMEVKRLWPPGWMQTRILFKESSSVHSYLTSRSRKLIACKKFPTPESVGVLPSSTGKLAFHCGSDLGLQEIVYLGPFHTGIGTVNSEVLCSSVGDNKVGLESDKTVTNPVALSENLINPRTSLAVSSSYHQPLVSTCEKPVLATSERSTSSAFDVKSTSSLPCKQQFMSSQLLVEATNIKSLPDTENKTTISCTKIPKTQSNVNVYQMAQKALLNDNVTLGKDITVQLLPSDTPSTKVTNSGQKRKLDVNKPQVISGSEFHTVPTNNESLSSPKKEQSTSFQTNVIKFTDAATKVLQKSTSQNSMASDILSHIICSRLADFPNTNTASTNIRQLTQMVDNVQVPNLPVVSHPSSAQIGHNLILKQSGQSCSEIPQSLAMQSSGLSVNTNNVSLLKSSVKAVLPQLDAMSTEMKNKLQTPSISQKQHRKEHGSVARQQDINASKDVKQPEAPDVGCMSSLINQLTGIEKEESERLAMSNQAFGFLEAFKKTLESGSVSKHIPTTIQPSASSGSSVHFNTRKQACNWPTRPVSSTPKSTSKTDASSQKSVNICTNQSSFALPQLSSQNIMAKLIDNTIVESLKTDKKPVLTSGITSGTYEKVHNLGSKKPPTTEFIFEGMKGFPIPLSSVSTTTLLQPATQTSSVMSKGSVALSELVIKEHRKSDFATKRPVKRGNVSNQQDVLQQLVADHTRPAVPQTGRSSNRNNMNFKVHGQKETVSVAGGHQVHYQALSSTVNSNPVSYQTVIVTTSVDLQHQTEPLTTGLPSQNSDLFTVHVTSHLNMHCNTEEQTVRLLGDTSANSISGPANEQQQTISGSSAVVSDVSVIMPQTSNIASPQVTTQ
ncbi:uncharacterized protein LOC143229847 isoform X3 [Tachypleus tridentatus]|uniref:uncharacterized protein LOC143229847 isoform X3 n=1 Tax=Tachypleus tridentatus TaxID=6853 RepID=UPI003FD6B9FB